MINETVEKKLFLDAYGLKCLTCKMTLSTDNPVPALLGLWESAHDGHEVEKEGF